MYPTPSFVTLCTGTASVMYGAVHAEKVMCTQKKKKHRSQKYN